MLTPDITNLCDLEKFTGQFSDRTCRQGYMQAERSGLIIIEAKEQADMEIAYEVIKENRAWFKRPISISFNDLMDISRLWPVDFFIVANNLREKLAAAIFYRGHSRIVQGIFWGDNEKGRPIMEVIDEWIKRRREIFDFYKKHFQDLQGISLLEEPGDEYFSNRWLTTIVIHPRKGRVQSFRD